jgi:hypothetical protein
MSLFASSHFQNKYRYAAFIFLYTTISLFQGTTATALLNRDIHESSHNTANTLGERNLPFFPFLLCLFI